jgi:hypothetical protein
MTSILKVDTIQDADGNNIINESSNTITVGASGDTTNVIGTLNKDGLAVENTPAFEAYQSAIQTGVGDASWTKLTMNTEAFDTDSMYDNSSNYRFTPTTAGKYFVYVNAGMFSETSNKMNVANVAIYKNGSIYKISNLTFNSGSDVANEVNATVCAVVTFNGSSDYVEAYARSNVTSGTSTLDARINTGAFGAYRLIGA